jgi:hypothetical protein
LTDEETDKKDERKRVISQNVRSIALNVPQQLELEETPDYPALIRILECNLNLAKKEAELFKK